MRRSQGAKISCINGENGVSFSCGSEKLAAMGCGVPKRISQGGIGLTSKGATKKKGLEGYAGVLVSRRKLFLLLLVALNLFALVGLFRIKINPDFSLFMPSGSVEMERYEAMNAAFGTGEQVMVLLHLPRELTPENLERVRQLSVSLSQLDGVNWVSGPVPEKMFQGLSLQPLQKVDEDNFEQVVDNATKMGALQALFEREDGWWAQLTIVPAQGVENGKLTDDVISHVQASGLSYEITGDLYLQTAIFDMILQIVLTLPPIAMVILLLVFRWRLGSFKATFLSILPAGLGALWTLGFLGWFGRDLSVVSVLTPIFTIVMGSADGLHFMSHLIDHRKEESDITKAMALTMRNVGKPIFLTTITTVAGFLSLMAIQSDAMAQMGLFASLGITMAGVATWIFLPPIASMVKPRGTRVAAATGEIPPHGGFFLDRLFQRLWGRKAVAVALLVLGAFVPGVFLLRTDFNMVTVYKPRTEVRKSLQTMEKVTGGSLPVFVEFTTTSDPLSNQNALHLLDVQQAMLDTEGVNKVVSVYDLFSAVYGMMFHTEQPEYPPNAAQVALIYRLVQGQPGNPVQNLLLREQNEGRMLLFPADLSGPTLQRIRDRLQQLSTDEVKLEITGLPYVMKEMNDRIIPDQLRSLLLAVVLVFFILWFSTRNFWISLFSLVPIAITLVALFGTMGYGSVTLSIITSTMASITIGVGIDYSIHFSALFQAFRKADSEGDRKGQNVRAAQKAFAYVAKPVLANALGLSLGMSVLVLSPLTLHSTMAMLMFVSMCVSALLSLTLLPTLLGGAPRQKMVK